MLHTGIATLWYFNIFPWKFSFRRRKRNTRYHQIWYFYWLAKCVIRPAAEQKDMLIQPSLGSTRVDWLVSIAPGCLYFLSRISKCCMAMTSSKAKQKDSHLPVSPSLHSSLPCSKKGSPCVDGTHTVMVKMVSTPRDSWTDHIFSMFPPPKSILPSGTVEDFNATQCQMSSLLRGSGCAVIANGLWRRGEKYLLRYNSTCQYDSLLWEWTERPSNRRQMEPVQYISYQTDLMNFDVPTGMHCPCTLIYVPYVHTLKIFFRGFSVNGVQTWGLPH